MDNLKPGATYVYESPDGGETVYVREFGAAPTTRVEIDAPMSANKQQILTRRAEMLEREMWEKIRRAAKTNITLQTALEQCIIIYKLSKDYENGI